MSDDLEREVRRLRDKASKQFDRLLAHSRDDPVEDWARDLFELAESLRQASCSRAVLDAPIEQSTTGAAIGKSMMRNAIEHMPLDSLTYHLGYHVARFDEMRLYWYRVKEHVWSAFIEDTYKAAEEAGARWAEIDIASGMYDGEEASSIELTSKETCILEAVGSKTLTGPQIAKIAGYTYNSRFRETLSNMVKRSILAKTSDGYCKPKATSRDSVT